MSALAALSADLEALVARTAPAVAAVEHPRGHGSGVVLSADGYLLTNDHVVGRARDVSVRLGAGDRMAAEVVGRDPHTDLAMLRVDARGLAHLPVRDDLEPAVGQLAVAIGSPLALDRSVTLGVVSALERVLPRPRAAPLEGLVQTDAAVNPGSSGGPLVDAEGRVLGITTAVLRPAQNIGFAVPARTVAWVAAELIRAGRVDRPRLGVAARGTALAPSVSARVGQARAVEILQVVAGSAAEEAGLRAGDLLLQANGRALGRVDDLQRCMVLGAPPELRLVLWRGAASEVVARPARRLAA